MNIFVNISHPAHVHLFKYAIGMLCQNGHKVIVGARKKEFTIELLKAYNIKHVVLTKQGRGLLGLIKELLEQQIKLSKIIKNNKRFGLLEHLFILNCCL